MADTLEVRLRELSERSNGGFVVRPRGVFGVAKTTQPVMMPVVFDFCDPETVPVVTRNTAISRGVVYLLSSICGVLGGRSHAQVASSIVQLLPIGMVSVHALRGARNQAMHKRASAVGDNSIALSAHVPLVGRNEFSIFRVNDGEKPSIERNKKRSIVLWDERTGSLATSLRAVTSRLSMRSTKERTASFAGKLKRHFRVLPECRAGVVPATPGTSMCLPEFYQMGGCNA